MCLQRATRRSCPATRRPQREKGPCGARRPSVYSGGNIHPPLRAHESLALLLGGGRALDSVAAATRGLDESARPARRRWARACSILAWGRAPRQSFHPPHRTAAGGCRLTGALARWPALSARPWTRLELES